MRRTILVTGGSGLVGKALEKVVGNDDNDTWIFLSSRDGDLRKKEDTFRMFETHKPTHVIHLAAKVGGLFGNMKYKVEFYRDNLLINDNVMEACKSYKVSKLISCLSTCVFPDKTSYPIDETMIHTGPPHPSNEGYAYAKRMVDVMNRAYHEEYGCKFTSIVPTNIFGPHDNYDLEDSHVIPGLIHKCYLAKRDNTPFVISGSGTPLRQFILSEDLARLILWVLDKYDSVEPIILSVNEEDEISIRDVALTIATAMNFTGPVEFDTSRADGQHKKTASNAKLRQLLGDDFVFTPFAAGVKTSVDWFLEHVGSARGTSKPSF